MAASTGNQLSSRQNILATQFLQILVGGVGCQTADVEVGPRQLIAVVGSAGGRRRARIGTTSRTSASSARRAAVALAAGPRAAATVAAVVGSSHAGLDSTSRH